MKVCFYHSEHPRERILADAFLEGCEGEERFKRPLGSGIADCDVACMVGVKSKDLIQSHWDRGITTVYLDKGYLRGAVLGPIKTWHYWRVSVNSHHPTDYIARAENTPERMESMGIKFKPWREGEHILIAGSSQKYHEFYGLHDPTRYTHKLVKNIRAHTARPIVYRPKPTWREAQAVKGANFNHNGGIGKALRNVHALVTHGSNACFEAVLNGVPCIVLGNAVARPISSTSLEDVENPYRATDDERARWLSNLVWCQFNLQEFSSGKAWSVIRPQIFGRLR